MLTFHTLFLYPIKDSSHDPLARQHTTKHSITAAVGFLWFYGNSFGFSSVHWVNTRQWWILSCTHSEGEGSAPALFHLPWILWWEERDKEGRWIRGTLFVLFFYCLVLQVNISSWNTFIVLSSSFPFFFFLFSFFFLLLFFYYYKKKSYFLIIVKEKSSFLLPNPPSPPSLSPPLLKNKSQMRILKAGGRQCAWVIFPRCALDPSQRRRPISPVLLPFSMTLRRTRHSSII